MEPDTLQRYWGCLYGVALGDACGAPVEFMHWIEIAHKYGKAGVTGLVENDGGPCCGLPPGHYTDDTQMTLATAQGLLACHADVQGLLSDTVRFDDCDPLEHIWDAYLEWYDLQSEPGQSRGPGGTCLSALQSSYRDWRYGTIAHPINNSKGCGGVMRTAPCGLVTLNPLRAYQLGAGAAAITHGHPDGFIPAGALSAMICLLKQNVPLTQAVNDTIRLTQTFPFAESTVALLKQARELVRTKVSPRHAFERMSSVPGRPGGGWVGDEALAIAVYCCLRHPDDWTAAVLEAVNHDGDSDSTGSIAGGILGTALGHLAIPEAWRNQVENHEGLSALAPALHSLLHLLH
jgi:ADP-ribosylglycohydrolase